MSFEIQGEPHWPAWAVPFLRALIRTADRGHLRPGIAAELAGVSRFTPYMYRQRHSEFEQRWAEVSVYARAVAEQSIERRVNGWHKESETV